MATNTLKTRIKHKYGTPAEWAQATNFSPLQGELIVYGGEVPKVKIGDGETNVEALPFITDECITVNLDATDAGVVPKTNANQLGGKSASEYALKSESVSSVNGKTGAVSLSATDVGAKPASYEAPVSSVNNKTGAVTLTASDVGARADSWMPTAAEINAWGKNESVNNSVKFNGKTWSQMLLTIYPIGSIYMSLESTSPASLFGGTWERITGRFLLGGSSDTYTIGSTGGEATHTLSEPELPTLYGHITMHSAETDSKGSIWWNPTGVFSTSPLHNSYNAPSSGSEGVTSISGITFRAGGDAAHNNMPPYLAVYMWKRTA